MRKLKLYLDTSVISHLFADDAKDKKSDTNFFWQELKSNKFDIYISSITLAELKECPEPKRTNMIKKLSEINHVVISQDEDEEYLANAYIKNGVLPQKCFDDCLHIACAVIANCDIIVSWNFKHLVNYKTIGGVKIVNALNYYKEISIMTPSMIKENS